MDDDREAYEFAYALYLARQADREAAHKRTRRLRGRVVLMLASFYR